jgi:outer membrane protein TolC
MIAGLANVQAQQDEHLSSSTMVLSLEECIRFTMENSFEVKLAQLDFLIAQTDLPAQEAIFDTVLSAEASYERDRREPLSVFGADDKQINIYSAEAAKRLPSGTEFTLSISDTREWDNSGFVSQNPAHITEVAIEARQALGKNIFGYIDRRNISKTRLTIQNADLDTKERIESLIAEVEKAYWEWVFCKERLKISRELLEKAKDLHKTNTKNYDIGRIEKADFLASQANVLIREKDVSIEVNRFRRAEENLKLLMNMDSNYRIYPQQTLKYRKRQLNLEDSLRQALQMRRDYQKGKRDIEIKNLILQTKANERWPEIDLVASLAANGINQKFSNATRDITNENNTDYFAGLEISIPIENNLAQSEFKEAEHEKEKALIALKNIERTIVTQVSNAFYDYVSFDKILVALIEAAQLQQEKLQEEEKRFKYGRSDTKRLIDYQEDYLKAQLEVARGIFELEISRVNLEKVLNIILARYEELL